jgi:hypothetical protein
MKYYKNCVNKEFIYIYNVNEYGISNNIYILFSDKYIYWKMVLL